MHITNDKSYTLIFLALFLFGAYSEHTNAQTTQSDSSSRIIVFRTGSLYGSVYDVLIGLNGRPKAVLGLSDYVEFKVPPGTHHIGVVSGSLLTAVKSVSVGKGSTVYLRASPIPNDSEVIYDAIDGKATISGYERVSELGFRPPSVTQIAPSKAR